MRTTSVVIGAAVLALTLTASASLASAQPTSELGDKTTSAEAQLIFGRDLVGADHLQKAQFLYSGQSYCWYPGGWRGPGYYWCGYAWRRGLGWGGPFGWNGWRWHSWHGGRGYGGGYGRGLVGGGFHGGGGHGGGHEVGGHGGGGHGGGGGGHGGGHGGGGGEHHH